MNNAMRERWSRFVSTVEPARATAIFIAVFYGIWAIYDVLDLAFGGTAATFWLQGGVTAPLTAVQAALVVIECVLVVLVARGGAGSIAVRVAIGAALVLRGIEAGVYFPLNDFFFYCTTSFVVLNIASTPGGVTAWPRRVLLYQTAWIYLATGLLKLNPHWLSGEHLWVRLNYFSATAGSALPWLALLRDALVDRYLAIAGSTMELAMGFALLLRAPRYIAIPLALAIHGFAALSVNVYFFGIAMIAQVWFVTGAYSSTRSSVLDAGIAPE